MIVCKFVVFPREPAIGCRVDGNNEIELSHVPGGPWWESFGLMHLCFIETVFMQYIREKRFFRIKETLLRRKFRMFFFIFGRDKGCPVKPWPLDVYIV